MTPQLMRETLIRRRPRWLTVGRSIAVFLGVYFLGMIGLEIVEAGAWTVARTRWTDQDETVYENFVAALGNSGHGNLNRFIHDPHRNPLYGQDDANISMSPDCADFPYQVRAYVAYKLKLPFGYITAIGGGRGDQRYTTNVRPLSFKDQSSFSSPRQMFGQITLVNSGYFRMSPHIENSDTYPVKIRPESIKPGTVYYDPNGHVAVVYQVTDDGRIRLIDAHPDHSLSRPWFGPKFARGTAANGGGFRRWRPQWQGTDGRLNRQPNCTINDFSGTEQYARSYQYQGAGMSYFDFVRARLSNRGSEVRPLEEFRLLIDDVFEDVKARVEAVEICIRKGIHRQGHPGSLPYNIYGTDGTWEEFSTPSRDARLKVAFAELFNRTVKMVAMCENRDPRLQYAGSPQQLAMELAAIYDATAPRLTFRYVNSRGAPVQLSFHHVLTRLFDLSFDPYHSIEYRWGARGDELRSSPDDADKQRMYLREARLRNQLERLYNVPTGLDLGPEKPVNVDVRQWLAAYVGQQTSTQVLVTIPESREDPRLVGGETPVLDVLAAAGGEPVAPQVAVASPAGELPAATPVVRVNTPATSTAALPVVATIAVASPTVTPARAGARVQTATPALTDEAEMRAFLASALRGVDQATRNFALAQREALATPGAAVAKPTPAN